MSTTPAPVPGLAAPASSPPSTAPQPDRAPSPPALLGTASIEHALDVLAGGGLVAVADSPDRESEVDLVVVAAAATEATVAAMIRYGSGFLCAAMTGEDLDRLALPPMTAINEDVKGTAYAVTCDAADGVTTGISARDRAQTLRVLADPASRPTRLHRPGHIVPLRARPGGVLVRAGHTEAGVDLARAAGCVPAAGIVELVDDDNTMLRHRGWPRYSAAHGLAQVPLVTVEALARWRRQHETHVRRLSSARLPTTDGTWTITAWRDQITGDDHLTLVLGDPSDSRPTLTRVHSECLTGEALGSLRCDCGPQLAAAMRAIATEGRGVIVYLRAHEGRGIGLAAKIAAYHAQDAGLDTVDANLALGYPEDARDYHVAGQILVALGVTAARVLTNNPAKTDDLAEHLPSATRIAIRTPVTEFNGDYLATKRDRMGHGLPADLLGAAVDR